MYPLKNVNSVIQKTEEITRMLSGLIKVLNNKIIKETSNQI